MMHTLSEKKKKNLITNVPHQNQGFSYSTNLQSTCYIIQLRIYICLLFNCGGQSILFMFLSIQRSLLNILSSVFRFHCRSIGIKRQHLPQTLFDIQLFLFWRPASVILVRDPLCSSASLLSLSITQTCTHLNKCMHACKHVLYTQYTCRFMSMHVMNTVHVIYQVVIYSTQSQYLFKQEELNCRIFIFLYKI